MSNLNQLQPRVPDHVLREEYRHLRDMGESDERIAKQLGFGKAEYLHVALRRIGLPVGGTS